MKLQPYIEKLNNSSEYKQFIGKYPKSFLIAGFFILDFEAGQNLHQVDYYIPGEKKVAAFTLDQQVKMQLLDTVGNAKKVPEELDLKTKIDLDALHGILEDEMKNRSMSEDIKKIIAVVQTVNGKKIWNLNCVLSGMEILRAHVEDKTETVLKMERISMMDVMKHIPKQALSQIQGNMSGKNLSMDSGAKSSEDSDDDEEMQEAESPETAEKQIEKLDKIEEEIERQKAKLKGIAEKKKAVDTEKKEAVKEEKAENKSVDKPRKSKASKN